MPSKYTVLQFLPNPASGERVNVGVIAYGPSGGYVRFLSRWDRVRAFARTDVSFLKDLTKAVIARVDVLTQAVREGFVPEFQPAEIEGWVAKWSFCVEFTEPRASLLNPA